MTREIANRAAQTGEPRMDAAGLWVVFNAWAVLSGWALSAAGMLNRPGYCLALAPLAVWAIIRRRRAGRAAAASFAGLGRFCRRGVRRPLPFLFALLAVLSLVGGLMYPPSNYDFLSYRFSRMLHWWDAGHWHWIPTANERMNWSGPNMEWAMMPLWALFGSPRFFFALNFVSFLLLPGLLFAVFRRLGLGGRTAWTWMWILPAGYAFATQSASTGNDLFGAVLGLIALKFALDAAKVRTLAPFGLAIIAAALATGVKASNLPLALPIGIALLPACRLLAARPFAAGAFCIAAAAVSFSPQAMMNFLHTGDAWGDPSNLYAARAGRWTCGVAGNLILTAAGWLAPPVLPFAGRWNAVAESLVPHWLAAGFPRFSIRFLELPGDENASMGVGITLLLAAAVVAGVALARTHERNGVRRSHRLWVMAGGWIALLAVFASLAVEAMPRIALPYYPLCIAAVLSVPGVNLAMRKRWWLWLAAAVTAAAVAVVVLAPARPLWPARTVLDRMIKDGRGGALAVRASAVYAMYAERADCLAPVRALLPPDAKVVGFSQDGDDIEVSLWQPYGSRRVIDLSGDDLADRRKLDALGIDIVVARGYAIRRSCGTPEEWIRRIGGKRLGSRRIIQKLREGCDEWFVVDLRRG